MSLNKTPIEWAKNPDGSQGYTWNPITGCLNHTPDGLCLGGGFPCYAYKLANGRLRQRYLANDNLAPIPYGSKVNNFGMFSNPFYPRFWAERIPSHTYHKMDWRGVPIGIFVCDMGELFGDWIPHDWQAEIFDVILNNPWHRFYLLTKQPQNLPKWSPFPDNCWVGVTATDSTMFAAAYYHLADIEARVKYISIEPLLDWDTRVTEAMIGQASQAGVGWLIIGAMTGTKYDIWVDETGRLEMIPKRYPQLTPMPWGKRWTFQPKIEWVEEIVQAADKAGISVFLKDNLDPLLVENFGKVRNQLYTLRDEEPVLRQELPE